MPSRRVIGVDAGGTKLLGGVVDEDLAVHRRVRRRLAGAGREEVLEIMAAAVAELRAAAPEAEAVGFGIPSLIDHGRGRSVTSVHLPLDDLPFGAVMEQRLGLPVVFDNDTNVAVLAEHRAGAARDAGEAVMLTVGTGIGGGLVIGGELYRGSVGAGGELGHVVIDLDGPPCQGACPNRGCLEAVASGGALTREGERVAREAPESGLGAALAEGRPLAGELVTALAHGGDAAARGVVELVGRRLGAGIAGLVNALNPEVVVIGGGAGAAGGELLLGAARAEVAARALAPSRDVVRILPAAFGDEAGMVGAGIMALDAAGVARA